LQIEVPAQPLLPTQLAPRPFTFGALQTLQLFGVPPPQTTASLPWHWYVPHGSHESPGRAVSSLQPPHAFVASSSATPSQSLSSPSHSSGCGATAPSHGCRSPLAGQMKLPAWQLPTPRVSEGPG